MRFIQLLLRNIRLEFIVGIFCQGEISFSYTEGKKIIEAGVHVFLNEVGFAPAVNKAGKPAEH